MDAPFDRGEIDRSSLDATERLRARLSGRGPAAEAPRRRTVVPWVIAGGLFVFLAGVIANPWFEANVRSKLPFVQPVTTVAEASEIAALRDRLARLEAPGAGSMPVERLARTEARVDNSSDQIAREADRIDRLTSQVAGLDATLRADRARSDAATATATAAADRAQAMLVLVLVRRAIESGRVLGGLDPALRQAFEARYPAAVRSVIALGAMPVTLASLQRDYDAMRPAIGAHPAADAKVNWWDTFTTALSSAVTRSPGGQGPANAAEAALQRGDTITAAALLRKMPAPRPPALSNWLAAADRLQAGTAGLAVLENAILVAPAPVAAPAASVAPAAVPAKAPQAAAAAPVGRTTHHISLRLAGMDRLQSLFDLPRLVAHSLRLPDLRAL